MSRRWLYVVPVLIGAAVAFAAWNRFVRPVGVTVAEVETDVPVQVYGLGTVEARVLSRVGFEVVGTVAELHADQHDTVARGAVLARLDRREQEARSAQAQASLKQAEAGVRQAQANLDKARTVLEERQRANRRQQTLVREKTVSAEAAESSQFGAEIAAAEVQQADAALALAQANFEQARASAGLEETRLAKHTLHSPYDAVVVNRRHELGTALGPGEPVFTLMDTKSVWVAAYVDEAAAGPLAVGQAARIRLRSLPGRQFAGRIARIDVESDRVSEERRVAVAFDAPPAPLHLGEQAEVEIEVGRLPRALLVPAAALTERGPGTALAWTLEDGRLARHEVALGHRLLDGRVEIVGGLPEGARLVSGPTTALREGGPAVAAGGAGK
jgi:HlyD family secretion protein